MVAHGEAAVAQRDLDLAARRAPLARVVEQVGDRAADALGLAAHDGRLQLERRSATPSPRRRCGALDERGARSASRRTSSTTSARRRPARELDDVADERGQLVELGDDVGAQRARSSGGRLVGVRRASGCWRAGSAIGVRSSWLASATRWRCASTERSSAVQRRVEAAGQPRAARRVPSTSRRCERSGLAVERLGALREARDRRERGARDDAAEHRRHRDAERADARPGSISRRSQRASTSVSGRATCTAPRSPRPTVSTRRCTPSTVDVASCRLPAAATRACGSSTGSSADSPRGRVDGAVGAISWITPGRRREALRACRPRAERGPPAGRRARRRAARAPSGRPGPRRSSANGSARSVSASSICAAQRRSAPPRRRAPASATTTTATATARPPRRSGCAGSRLAQHVADAADGVDQRPRAPASSSLRRR